MNQGRRTVSLSRWCSAYAHGTIARACQRPNMSLTSYFIFRSNNLYHHHKHPAEPRRIGWKLRVANSVSASCLVVVSLNVTWNSPFKRHLYRRIGRRRRSRNQHCRRRAVRGKLTMRASLASNRKTSPMAFRCVRLRLADLSVSLSQTRKEWRVTFSSPAGSNDVTTAVTSGLVTDAKPAWLCFGNATSPNTVSMHRIRAHLRPKRPLRARASNHAPMVTHVTAIS